MPPVGPLQRYGAGLSCGNKPYTDRYIIPCMKNFTTAELEEITALLTRAYRLAARGHSRRRPPERIENFRWAVGHYVHDIHKHYKPAARPYAWPAVVIGLRDVLALLVEHYEDLPQEQRQALPAASQVPESPELPALRAQIEALKEMLAYTQAEQARLTAENEALQRKIQAGRRAEARKPTGTTTLEIPGTQIQVTGGVSLGVLHLIGSEGAGRSWRIIQQLMDDGLTRNENTVRNSIKTLIDSELIQDFKDTKTNEPITWATTAGGARRLIMLTKQGRSWYQQAYGQPPAESELLVMSKKHKSVLHGVAILETRDHLRAQGYEVDADPAPVLKGDDPQGVRTEPDLVATIDGRQWAVEVQREVNERLLDKWLKSLELMGALALVLVSESDRGRQQRILDRAHFKGEVRLISIEAMDKGDWQWSFIQGE